MTGSCLGNSLFFNKNSPLDYLLADVKAELSLHVEYCSVVVAAESVAAQFGPVLFGFARSGKPHKFDQQCRMVLP